MKILLTDFNFEGFDSMKRALTLADAPELPGTVLRRNLERHGITQDSLADAMGVSRLTVNQIVNSKRSITAEMALRLSKVLDTTPDVWLNMQMDLDLFEAKMSIGDEVDRLKVIRSTNRRS